MADERWYTTRQVAELLQVDEQTVRRWLREGRLSGVQLSRRAGWRVGERDLNEFLGRGSGKVAA